jgi:hypothetical protein
MGDEKITQSPDFFVETLIALNQFDSEVGALRGSIIKFGTSTHSVR